MAGLHRYWFTFRGSEKPSILNVGSGVTAYDLEDAKALLEQHVFPLYGQREIAGVIVDVYISTIESMSVRGNMKVPVFRGVWFPLT